MTYQVDYTANGTSSVFPFPFAIETEADCQVLLSGVLQSGDYSIRGQGSIDGGAVVFDNPPLADVVVTLRRRGELSATASDAGTGYLADKLKAGTGISLTTETALGGVQQVRIDADDVTAAEVIATLEEGENITLNTVIGPDGVQRVRIDAADVSVADLAAKLKEGKNIVLDTVTGLDGVERLRISADDVTAADINAIMRAGANITLSIVNESGVDTLHIDARDAADQIEAGTNVTFSPGSNGRTAINATQPDMSNVLRRNVSAVVEAGFWSKPVALSVTGGIATPNPDAGAVFTLTVTSNFTLGFPSGMAGKAGMFMVVAKQDATGGRTLTLAPGYALAGGEWSTQPNAVNLLWVTSDGSGSALDVVIAQRGA